MAGIAYSRDEAKLTVRRVPDRPGIAAAEARPAQFGQHRGGGADGFGRRDQHGGDSQRHGRGSGRHRPDGQKAENGNHQHHRHKGEGSYRQRFLHRLRHIKTGQAQAAVHQIVRIFGHDEQLRAAFREPAVEFCAGFLVVVLGLFQGIPARIPWQRFQAIEQHEKGVRLASENAKIVADALPFIALGAE